GRFAVAIAVMLFGVLPVGGEELDDGWAGGALAGPRGPPDGQPLGEEGLVPGLAHGRAELAQVMVPAVQRDDGLAGGPVETVGRGTRQSGHGVRPGHGKPGTLPGSQGLRAALPTAGR